MERTLALPAPGLGAVVAVRAFMAGRGRPATMVLRAPPVGPDDLASLHIPALVLIGSRDPLLADVRTAVSASRSVTVSVVEGASHLFEEPGTLERALQETVAWFRSQLAGTASASAARRPLKAN
jgi:putative phosphoribosyl transferase